MPGYLIGRGVNESSARYLFLPPLLLRVYTICPRTYNGSIEILAKKRVGISYADTRPAGRSTFAVPLIRVDKLVLKRIRMRKCD